MIAPSAAAHPSLRQSDAPDLIRGTLSRSRMSAMGGNRTLGAERGASDGRGLEWKPFVLLAADVRF